MRLLIFNDPNVAVPANVILATLRTAAESPDLEVCGLVTTRPQQFEPLTATARVRRRARDLGIAVVDRRSPPRRKVVRRIDTQVLADHGVPLITPHNGDINSAAFLALVEHDLRPDVALSYFCGTIFKRPLLERLPQAVNLHPALLPQYRGLRPVQFARYYNEEFTGITFHRMAEGIDTGPILAQRSVRIAADESLDALVDRLAIVAAAAVPDVLDLVRANAPGEPQQGAASYFSARDADALFTVSSPHEVSYDELQRRIHAFGAVRMTIDGASVRVTRLCTARPGTRFAFRTADGMVVAPDRIAGLPRALALR